MTILGIPVGNREKLVMKHKQKAPCICRFYPVFFDHNFIQNFILPIQFQTITFNMK